MRALLLAALLGLGPAFARAAGPCPSVEFLGRPVELTQVEERWVCGDPGSEGWKSVPLAQAEYFLRAFLQQRGYHRPLFQVEGGTLTVAAGPVSRITSVTGEGLPPEVRLSKRRRVVGQVMTPKELDRLQAWIKNSLRNHGYGCPAIELSADPETGAVKAVVRTGPKHVITEIVPEVPDNVDPRVFNRFRAYRIGRPLDLRLLNLTAGRIVSEDLFLSAYYDLSCSSDSALTVTQRVVAAPPRLITAGAGLDSEGLVRGRARWKHSRIGARASSLEGVLFASAREQSVEALMRAYFDPDTRVHLIPRLEGRHQDEARFESLTGEFSITPALTEDTQGLGLEFRAGPGYEYVRTMRGQGPADAAYPTWTMRLALASHLYEHFLRDPQDGWQLRLETSSRQKGLQSDFSAHQVKATGEALFNLGAFDPPLLILGSRFGAATTITDREGVKPGVIPPTLRYFLGGDADLRGFSRQELPVNAEGFLTQVYHGLELRLGDVLPWGLQPLAFVDAAMAGRRHAELERAIYWSPGAGIRWATPVGSIRATVGRGMVERQDPGIEYPLEHWQYFFSLGREF
jgi:translocation and assembly module TamA